MTIIELPNDDQEAIESLIRAAQALNDKMARQNEAAARNSYISGQIDRLDKNYRQEQQVTKEAAERDTSLDIETAMAQMRAAQASGTLTPAHTNAVHDALDREASRRNKAEAQINQTNEVSDNANTVDLLKQAKAAFDRGDRTESDRLYKEAWK